MPRPPRRVISAAVSWMVPGSAATPAWVVRPVTYSVVPGAASATAVPRPMPRLAPVTRITRSDLRLIGVDPPRESCAAQQQAYSHPGGVGHHAYGVSSPPMTPNVSPAPAYEGLRRHGIGELVTRSAARHPDKIALVFGNTRYTYRALEQTINRATHALAA